jgi:hypothetical protein
MSDLGESVINAFSFLDGFVKDVSKLVTTVEENITSNKLTPLWGSNSFWAHSHAYYSPVSWLPRYVARQYVSEVDEDSKPSKRAPWFAFFCVYFTPEPINEPVAVWGFGIQKEKKELWEPFNQLLLNNRGPGFLVTVPVEEWESLETVPKPLSAFKYQARFAVELSSAQVVDQIVIQTMNKEISELLGSE